MADEEKTEKVEKKTETETTEEPDGTKTKKVEETEETEEEKVSAEDDWQTKARKHERAAKAERKKREQAEAEIQKREDANKSETQKAIDAARAEGEEKARKEGEESRRSDRLEMAVTRLSKGMQTGEGDDAKTIQFADEDVLLRLERKVRSGDVDADDLFDGEGKVNTETLNREVGEILGAAKYLIVGDGEPPKPSGDPDTRKGDKAGKDLESMTPDDHAKARYEPAGK